MDEYWSSQPYQPGLKCLTCKALGGLVWQNVVNLTKQKTTVFMTCACGFSYQLVRATDEDDFRRWEQQTRLEGSGMTTDQHKKLAELSKFIDEDLR